jgi:hypothetical protein
VEIFGFHVEREYVRQNGVHDCCDAPSHVYACIGYLATRSRDATSESLQPIQSERAEYDVRAVRLPRAKFYVASPIPLPARECFRSSHR